MTSTQPISNFPDWKSLAGTTLDGGYELKEIVQADQSTATLRVRVLGDYTLKALARFYVVEKSAAQEQVTIWQTVHWLEQKTNLSAPLGAGRLLLNGLTIAYLVFQVPDETLADAIRSRALAPEEALEVLRSAARGLSELHAAGFVHGCVSPEEILAIGDTIRCSTEGVRRVDTPSGISKKPVRYLAPESSGQNVTAASDVWCLGATLFEVVTQKKYEPRLFQEAENLRHPFGVLTACCLDPDPEKRCKLSDLDRISKSKPPAPKPKPPITPVSEEAQPSQPQALTRTAAAGAAGGLSTPQRVIVAPQQSSDGSTNARAEGLAESAQPLPSSAQFVSKPPAAPIAMETPLKGGQAAAKKTREEDEQVSGRRGWIYALAGFIVIFFLLWFFRTPSHRATPPSSTPAPHATPPPQTPAAANSSAQKTAWPTKTLTPPGTPEARPAPSSTSGASPAPANAAAEGQPRPFWRVILYTYNRQQDANAKAQDLAAKRPDLRATVFSPNGNAAPYLVVAGGQMTRQEAASLRLRALREGMPRDSYLQNFSK